MEDIRLFLWELWEARLDNVLLSAQTMCSVMERNSNCSLPLQHLAFKTASAYEQEPCKPAGVAHQNVKGTCMLHKYADVCCHDAMQKQFSRQCCVATGVIGSRF